VLDHSPALLQSIVPLVGSSHDAFTVSLPSAVVSVAAVMVLPVVASVVPVALAYFVAALVPAAILAALPVIAVVVQVAEALHSVAVDPRRDQGPHYRAGNS
jgi:hypothetical protein